MFYVATVSAYSWSSLVVHTLLVTYLTFNRMACLSSVLVMRG